MKKQFRDPPLIATVQKIVPGGRGTYVVTTSTNLNGSITFSLKKPVWGESTHPEAGSIVILEDVRKQRQGWRAYRARFVRPEDEQ